MRKILIIGGTGTISTSITQTLANDPEVKLTLINRGHHNEKLDPRIEILIGDMSSTHGIQELLIDRTFDSVIDFIIFTPDQAYQRIDLFKKITKQFIFISTVACLDHEHALVINEQTPRGNRFSLYGRNKAAAEEVFLSAYKKSGFPITIIRPSQTYSEHRIPLSVKGNSCWPVINRLIQGKEVIIHGDGESVWASTHADDFAKGFIPLINHPETIGEIIQIMNPASHTFNDVYRILAKALKVNLKPVYVASTVLAQSTSFDFLTSIQGDKMFSCIYDVSKLKRLVPDFDPKISLEEGLLGFLKYMQDHPELKVEEPAYDAYCDVLIERVKKDQTKYSL
ncbi:MAG: NAD-dependent epimerase/dehydratase [Erysipelotrichaceae bacterium]|nr:MAG: NAD-dependent [Erysipelotrichaceae bacterium]TXT18630.1 MAG: NAD-dependent epimerase/dehydratase [Erysipelotrichaceae bacterium]